MIFSDRLTQQQIDAGFAEVMLNGNKESIAFYADFVSNPNIAEERYGRLPVWLAMEGEDSYTKTKIVLSLKPDVNVRNNHGQTPAMVALEKRMQGIGILFLRHDGLDIAATDNQGNDYMKYAVLSRSPNAVYAATKRGIPVDRLDKDGFMPAYWAVKNKDMDVFRALCDCGLQRDMNSLAYRKVMHQAQLCANEERDEAWILAVRDGVFPERKTYELTQDWPSLLKRMERLSAKNQWKLDKMLGIASFDKEPVICGKEKDVSLLLSHALFEQCRYGSAEDVSLLLFVGADPNMRDKMGRTPLFCAVNYKGVAKDKKTPEQISQVAYQKVKILLESGANPNMPNVIDCGGKIKADDTPLEQSLYLDRVGISILLIKAGAKVNALNAGYPLAKLAVLYAKPEAINVLARANADLMQADDEGITPIEYAILNDKPYNIVALRRQLIDQGREDLFNPETTQGKRLYELAMDKNPLITEALNGKLHPLAEVKQCDVLKVMTFDEKMANLSESEYLKLAKMAGADMTLEEKRSVENNVLHATKKLPDRAENRHTMFRQALAVFKRNQRSKMRMEQVQMKQKTRSQR